VIYVDSNVLIDFLEADPNWSLWSGQQLEDARIESQLVAGAMVASEIGYFAKSPDQVARSFEALGVELVSGSFESAWLASQAFRQYKKRGGERDSLLVDFIIGAEAQAMGARLLTRDKHWYQGYFPELKLIHPEIEEND
jgi:predicted nucleic acid-binding protein